MSTPWTGFFDFYLHPINTPLRNTAMCVNALNGLLWFLRYPLRARINTDFAGSFLQIFIWKFWNQAFFAHFLACSQFVHIWRKAPACHNINIIPNLPIKWKLHCLYFIICPSLYITACLSIRNLFHILSVNRPVYSSLYLYLCKSHCSLHFLTNVRELLACCSTRVPHNIIKSTAAAQILVILLIL